MNRSLLRGAWSKETDHAHTAELHSNTNYSVLLHLSHKALNSNGRQMFLA